MNIKQALKRKNKLIQLIGEELKKFQNYNSIDNGPGTYDARKAFDNWNNYSNELIGLKCKIHLANAPMYHKIFRLSELKSRISSLQSFYINEGRYNVVETNGMMVQKSHINVIGVIEKDNYIKEFEAEIEQIQEELDEFNVKTIL